jgi:hypothetical protein
MPILTSLDYKAFRNVGRKKSNINLRSLGFGSKRFPRKFARRLPIPSGKAGFSTVTPNAENVM